MNFCRNCDRYLSPPNSWLLAELESRELLAICLRKLKGLKEVRLVDAGFIWTEPHSKRLRLKLTVQKEVSPHPRVHSLAVIDATLERTTGPISNYPATSL